MIDSHCHLDSEEFDGERDAIVKRALKVGIKAVINPGADAAKIDAPIKVAEKYSNVYAALGVHPGDILKIGDGYFNDFEKLLSHEKVVGIGEVGLENSSGIPPMETQLKTLNKFVEQGLKHDMPIVFHIRDAHKEFRTFLENYPKGFPGVMHCFTGSLDDARFYMERGFYISIAAIVTFPNAQNLRDAVAQIPLNKILIETDAPLLAPQTFRGKRNEPAFVLEVAKKIAEIKGVPVEEVDRITEENTRRVFGLTP